MNKKSRYPKLNATESKGNGSRVKYEKKDENLTRTQVVEGGGGNAIGPNSIENRRIDIHDQVIEYYQNKLIDLIKTSKINSEENGVLKKELEEYTKKTRELEIELASRFREIEILEKDYLQRNELLEDKTNSVKIEKNELINKVSLLEQSAKQIELAEEAFNTKMQELGVELESERAHRVLLEKKLQLIMKSSLWKVVFAIRNLLGKPKKYRHLRQSTQNIIKLVKASGYFDADWYMAQHPELGIKSSMILEYYCTEGIYKNHDPGPNFSCDGYSDRYSDVKQSGIPSFVHFIFYGKSEGRFS